MWFLFPFFIVTFRKIATDFRVNPGIFQRIVLEIPKNSNLHLDGEVCYRELISKFDDNLFRLKVNKNQNKLN